MMSTDGDIDTKEFSDYMTLLDMSKMCSSMGYHKAIERLNNIINERRATAMDTLHPIIAAALRPYVEPVGQTVRDAIIDSDYYLVDVRKNLIIEHLGSLLDGEKAFAVYLDQAVVKGLTVKLHGWCNV